MNKSSQPNDLRTFLGSGQPPLKSAVELLVKQYRNGRTLDMSQSLIVLPTTRAVERLSQLLLVQADQQSLFFTPPEIITVGKFPERLYPIHQEFATDLCQQLAWSKALQESTEEQIEVLFPGMFGSSHDAWQPYAKLLSDLHKRLGNDVWSFSSVVREVQKIDKNFRELDRWEALKAIQKRYYDILKEAEFWDKQAARNVAVKRELCSTDKRVIMIGTADLNRSTKMMLGQIRSQVQILVAAPRKLSARFDEFGGIVTEQWLHVPIEFPSDCIRIVDSAEDQSFAVAHYISSLGDQYSADQITIGIPDPEIQPQVQRSLNAIGVKHRDLKGQQVKHTPPVRLMTAMLEFLDQQNFTTFSALIRHPDMFQWICNGVKKNHWLGLFDNYQQNGLPDRVELGSKNPFGNPETDLAAHADAPERAERFAENTKLLNQIHKKISQLFAKVTGPDKPIAEWTQPWCEILSEIYGDRILDKNRFEDQQITVACRELYKALRDKIEVPPAWNIRKSAAKAMQMAIEAASDWSVIPPAIPDAIELSGWLDLPLDDAEVVIITGMNDENVPASENGHLFLPNRLCKTLGILDNDRRYARDAYALTLIKGVRSKLLMIAGRKDLQGEPKKPSRLLFADDNETLAQRANAFFSFEGKADSRYWLADPAHAPFSQQFEIPYPSDFKPLTELSVTAFKEFLRCPYRFYLSKILRLETAADTGTEMDPRAFGNLAHEVLESFGLSDTRDSQQEKQIVEFLNSELDRRVDQLYRGSRLPAVRIQIEQMRLRLQQFASLQAKRASEGWRIVSAEEKVVHPLTVDGEEFQIKGTIDRVDVHESTRQVEIWDYKTSDKGDDPTTVHLTRSGWKDLQLPLYRHLVKQIKSIQSLNLDTVNLGYVLLPKQIDRVRFSLLECTSEQLAEADEQVESIVRQIRGGKFWPPKAKPPEYSQDFAGICQDNAFEKFDVDSVETPA